VRRCRLRSSRSSVEAGDRFFVLAPEDSSSVHVAFSSWLAKPSLTAVSPVRPVSPPPPPPLPLLVSTITNGILFSRSATVASTVTSVPDPCHSGVDPDPRIHASDYWIRIEILLPSSLTFKTPYLQDPDPGGPKTCGSGRSGSGTLTVTKIDFLWIYNTEKSVSGPSKRSTSFTSSMI
jgi:hypothetical protein